MGGKIERDLTVEQLRARIGELLRRYVPASTLPTPITNGGEELGGAEDGNHRVSMSHPLDSRLDARMDSRMKSGGER